jgi:acyl carrier protein
MGPTQSELELWVRNFVVTHLLGGDYRGPDPLQDRELDSLLLEELIDNVEETFGILLDEEEISRENFATTSIFARVVLHNIERSPWLAPMQGRDASEDPTRLA